MSFHLRLDWRAGEPGQGEYCRDHSIHFGSGQRIQASAAPEYLGSEDKVNPEESLLAALAACHMLTFLAIAHLKRLPVASYTDRATAVLGKNASGRLAVTRISLNPRIDFADGIAVSRQTLEKLHHKAHNNCFIANSISAEVDINFLPT